MRTDADLGFDHRVLKTSELEIRHHARMAARLTGHHQRGNERHAADYPRNRSGR